MVFAPAVVLGRGMPGRLSLPWCLMSEPSRFLFFFFSSRRRHTISVSAFLLNRSSDLLKQMLRDFIGIRVNRAKKSGMVNITSSVNSRERSGINTILHELNPLFTINVTMRDIKSKNVYSRVNSKATTQWRKTESANG